MRLNSSRTRGWLSPQRYKFYSRGFVAYMWSSSLAKILPDFALTVWYMTQTEAPPQAAIFLRSSSLVPAIAKVKSLLKAVSFSEKFHDLFIG
jgi:hypothetical protein